MEEFLKQAREFYQSFWGGLLHFLIGVSSVASYYFFWPIRKWLAIAWLTLAVGWTVFLFLTGRTLFGVLLASIVLAGIARTTAIEVQKRGQKT